MDEPDSGVKKAAIVALIIALIIIMALFAVSLYLDKKEQKRQAEIDDSITRTIQCLQDKQVRVYVNGTSSVAWKKQLAQFRNQSLSELMIDCSLSEPAMAACQKLGIEEWPVWQGDALIYGVFNPGQLWERAEC